MSRLEEVKHLVGYVNKAVEDDDGNNVITTLIELTSEGHIDWLIKQAELSREWQLVATDRFNDWYKADQLNNRYKQALEFYADRDNYKLEHFDPNLDDYMSTVDYDEGKTARNALEGEE